MHTKAWVDNWKRVGPILERIEAEELRRWETKDAIRRLMPMIDWCCERAVPRTTSGMIEMQRFFTMIRNRREIQGE